MTIKGMYTVVWWLVKPVSRLRLTVAGFRTGGGSGCGFGFDSGRPTGTPCERRQVDVGSRS